MGKNIHVTHRPDGNWNVIGEGNKRPTAVVKTQKAGIEIATEKARIDHVEVVIHGLNGKIREKNSYGNDPYPPKG